MNLEEHSISKPLHNVANVAVAMHNGLLHTDAGYYELERNLHNTELKHAETH